MGSKTDEIDRIEKLLDGYIYEKASSEEGQREHGIFSLFLGSFRRLHEIIETTALYAGEPVSSIRRKIGTALFFTAVLVVLAVLTHFTPLFFLIPLPLAIYHFKTDAKIKRRSREFDKDYPTLLLSLVSSVRTGLDPLSALFKIQDVFRQGSVICQELQRLCNSVDCGVGEEKAIREFGSGIRGSDVKLFHTAYILAKKEGSSLGACLERLVRVTRARQSFKRKVKAAVALQKFSAMGIAACSLLIGLIQYTANAESFIATFHDPLGFKAVLISSSLMAFGLFWMFRIGSNEL